MESVDHICSCQKGLSEAQKKQADAIAGGSFDKLLAEFQILRASSGEKNRTASSKNQFANSRASDIRDIFFLQQGATDDATLSLEKFFSSTKSENQFSNSRASNIRDIFFPTQEKLKESEPELFDNSVPLDLEKLRRDPNTPRGVPGFLEKRFEIFGPTVISRFV